MASTSEIRTLKVAVIPADDIAHYVTISVVPYPTRVSAFVNTVMNQLEYDVGHDMTRHYDVFTTTSPVPLAPIYGNGLDSTVWKLCDSLEFFAYDLADMTTSSISVIMVEDADGIRASSLAQPDMKATLSLTPVTGDLFRVSMGSSNTCNTFAPHTDAVIENGSYWTSHLSETLDILKHLEQINVLESPYDWTAQCFAVTCRDMAAFMPGAKPDQHLRRLHHRDDSFSCPQRSFLLLNFADYRFDWDLAPFLNPRSTLVRAVQLFLHQFCRMSQPELNIRNLERCSPNSLIQTAIEMLYKGTSEDDKPVVILLGLDKVLSSAVLATLCSPAIASEASNLSDAVHDYVLRPLVEAAKSRTIRLVVCGRDILPHLGPYFDSVNSGPHILRFTAGLGRAEMEGVVANFVALRLQVLEDSLAKKKATNASKATTTAASTAVYNFKSSAQSIAATLLRTFPFSFEETKSALYYDVQTAFDVLSRFHTAPVEGWANATSIQGVLLAARARPPPMCEQLHCAAIRMVKSSEDELPSLLAFLGTLTKTGTAARESKPPSRTLSSVDQPVTKDELMSVLLLTGLLSLSQDKQDEVVVAGTLASSVLDYVCEMGALFESAGKIPRDVLGHDLDTIFNNFGAVMDEICRAKYGRVAAGSLPRSERQFQNDVVRILRLLIILLMHKNIQFLGQEFRTRKTADGTYLFLDFVFFNTATGELLIVEIKYFPLDGTTAMMARADGKKATDNEIAAKRHIVAQKLAQTRPIQGCFVPAGVAFTGGYADAGTILCARSSGADELGQTFDDSQGQLQNYGEAIEMVGFEDDRVLCLKRKQETTRMYSWIWASAAGRLNCFKQLATVDVPGTFVVRASPLFPDSPATLERIREDIRYLTGNSMYSTGNSWPVPRAT